MFIAAVKNKLRFPVLSVSASSPDVFGSYIGPDIDCRVWRCSWYFYISTVHVINNWLFTSYPVFWLCRTYDKFSMSKYEGWNFNSGNYLFTTDTK